MHADLLFRGAFVVDGSGRPGRQASVAVGGGRILAIGSIDQFVTHDRVIDVHGLVLCPGFIDVHTHSDVSVLLDPRCESKVLQGVTTDVTGNCGFSPFPVASKRQELHEDHLARLGDDPVALTWRDLDGYAAAVAAVSPAINIAPLVGHGAVRMAAIGATERPVGPAELGAMRAMVQEALRQGAFGFSTGLTHVPSAYGDTAEVTNLVRVVAQHDALYATHVRDLRDYGEFLATGEAIDTARTSGARLQHSHLAINDPDRWCEAAGLLGMFEDARAAGIDVAFDVYPYDASSSSLTQYIPAWIQAGGTGAMRDRLSNQQARAQAEAELAKGWFGGIPWHWDRVMLAQTGQGDEWMVGRSLSDVARVLRADPVPLTLDLCVRHGNNVQVVLFYRLEEDVTAFLAHPMALVGSDGSAVPLHQAERRPHPRGFGTHPRVLGRYVRENPVLSLEGAIHKMTGAVASRLQLADRGLITDGLVADLVVFDPATIMDQATFTDPARAPTGVLYVAVNGRLVVEEGQQTTARPGRVLRRR